jgi:hypothetical protein
MPDHEKQPRKLAALTPFEDKCWTFAFCTYLEKGKSDATADKLTWRDMQLDFPRLRIYGGCRP